MRHSISCPISRLDLHTLPELCAQVAQIRLDARVVPEEEPCHESEDHVVDLPIFGYAQIRTAICGRRDVERPRSAERQPLVRNPHPKPLRRLCLGQFERNLLSVAILLPPSPHAV